MSPSVSPSVLVWARAMSSRSKPDPPQQPVIKRINGIPSVSRFSSMFDFIELCEVGVFIRSMTLDCELHKMQSMSGMGMPRTQ